jgi:hypothetical protein
VLTHCERCGGSADSAGAASAANRLAWLPSIFRKGRSFSEGSSAAVAASAACRAHEDDWVIGAG